MIVGGAAAPQAMIEGFERRHGLHITHAWGMTEMAPMGTISAPLEPRARAPRGRAVPLPRQARDSRPRSSRSAPAAATASCRGTAPRWASSRCAAPGSPSSYYDAPEASDRWTDDGWFKTGDIVTIEPNGYVEIQDRSKDLVKSGGEWISTVALENALMGHPAVLEAAVIAVPDEKWSERPLAVVVFREGQTADADELRAFLAPNFAKWWLPERFEVVDEIPKTAVGKFRKTALREQFARS